jgi:hypothetical protein
MALAGATTHALTTKSNIFTCCKIFYKLVIKPHTGSIAIYDIIETKIGGNDTITGIKAGNAATSAVCLKLLSN